MNSFRQITHYLKAGLTAAVALALPFAITPAKADADFNLDGKNDLVWANRTTGQIGYWSMNGATELNSSLFTLNPGTNWRIVDSPDLNGDGKPDLLFQNKTTGQVAYWLMDGVNRIGYGYISPTVGLEWKLIATPDLNGDGVPDFLWQNQNDGQAYYWIMGGTNGTTIVSNGAISTPPGNVWHLVAATDLDRDGKPDLLWQNATSGDLFIWYMNGVTPASYSPFPYSCPADWEFVGVTDLNNDGSPDLLFQNKTTGIAAYWLMSGLTRTAAALVSPFAGADWRLVGLTGGTAQARATSVVPQENSDLYGIVRLRVKNLTNPLSTVSVSVGGIAARSTTVAYTDRNAPTSGSGGAIDFRVPYGLMAGSANIVVTVNGVALAPLPVMVPTADPFATFTLDTGAKFVVDLRQDKAPLTVANFVGLATGTKAWTNPVTNLSTNDPLYDGTKFHRCISGFVRQGGDPFTKFDSISSSRWGQGGPGYYLNFETTGLQHDDGAVAMARSSALDSAGSQFYICDGAQHFLDDSYCVFGKVVENLPNAKAITITYIGNSSTPISGVIPTVLTSVRISGKLATN